MGYFMMKKSSDVGKVSFDSIFSKTLNINKQTKPKLMVQ